MNKLFSKHCMNINIMLKYVDIEYIVKEFRSFDSKEG